MSYLSDWQPQLELQPSIQLNLYFKLGSALMIGVAVFISYLNFMLLPSLPLLLLFLFWVKRKDILLSHPTSVVALFAKDAKWLVFLKNRQEYSCQLRSYFLSRHFMVLHFVHAENIHSSSWWRRRMGKKYSLMVFPDQLGEQAYRRLFVCLKLQRTDLFRLKN